MKTYYKAFTHDLRSPLRGGGAVWDGKLPYLLPEVAVDSGPKECSAGWNATRSVADCLKIAGFWRAPWPMRVFAVHPNGHELFERGDKVRSATWNIASECGLAEIESAIYQLSESWFAKSKMQSKMGREQFLWYRAFASSVRDESAVVTGLSAALEMRGLKWSLKKYPSETAALDARDAWTAWTALDARDAWTAWTALDARDALDALDARDAWTAWTALDARGARDARDAWDAWAARGARDARDAWDAWAARDARDAWDARDALTVYFSASMKWTNHDPKLLTTGIRDAYAGGLLAAIPTAENEIGYVMKPEVKP